MPLKVAVQMDAIDAIKIAGDTTFALMLEATARGHDLFYYRPEDLSLRDGAAVAHVAPVEVRDIVGNHFSLGPARTIDLAEMDVVLLRQDPPFDLAYITSTHILQRLQPGTLVVNDPVSVRNAPEKLFVLDYPQLMPATLITRDRAEIDAFRRQHGEIVMKPLHGHGGVSVFKIAERDANFGSLYDLFAQTYREQWVVQAYLKNIVQGDKRIILVEGEPLGAINRVPAENDIRSNMVRGGAAAATQFTDRELEICATIGPELKRRDLLLVGIDVIDGCLTEINVTSPTGIRAIERVGGPDLAVAVWDAIEAKRERRKEAGPSA